MPLPTYHIYVQLNAFPSNTSALLTHSPFPCLLLDFPYPSSCPCFPSSQPIPLSHCLDVRQTYQSPPRPPSINAGDIPSRERTRRNLFQTTMSTRVYPIGARQFGGRRVNIKWCEVSGSWAMYSAQPSGGWKDMEKSNHWALAFPSSSIALILLTLLSLALAVYVSHNPLLPQPFWSLISPPKMHLQGRTSGKPIPHRHPIATWYMSFKSAQKTRLHCTEFRDFGYLWHALPPDPLNSLCSQKRNFAWPSGWLSQYGYP